jgi:tRNA-dihydrouridine synthase
MVNDKWFNDKFIIGLSPMDGYTDEPFRLVQAEISKPDVIFTEFVSAEGLSRGGVGLYDVLLYSPLERPIIGQIFGKDPESFYKSAIVLCHLGFDGVDINMGCPAKTVTQNGSGAALIAKPELASEIIKAARSGIDDWFNKKVTIDDLKLNQKTHAVIARNLKYSSHIPNIGAQPPTFSVKTRVGITESVVDAWIPHLLSHDLDFISLHGRTLKQGYSGLAAWQEIKKAATMAHQTSTKLFGNGDVTSPAQAIQYGQEFGADGVLIGRAALGNPWIFSADKEGSYEDKFHAMVRHAYHFNRIFPHRLFDSLRKHFLIYASGHPQAKQLRSQLVSLSSLDQLYAIEQDFLNC